jgi:hypothetical protein
VAKVRYSSAFPPPFCRDGAKRNRAEDEKGERKATQEVAAVAVAMAQYLGGGELGQATQEALQLLQLHLLPLPSPSLLPLSRCRRSTRRTPWNGGGAAVAAAGEARRRDTGAPDPEGGQSFLGPEVIGLGLCRTSKWAVLLADCRTEKTTQTKEKRSLYSSIYPL